MKIPLLLIIALGFFFYAYAQLSETYIDPDFSYTFCINVVVAYIGYIAIAVKSTMIFPSIDFYPISGLTKHYLIHTQTEVL